MTEPNQIRINELARELEVKAKAIIDYLPDAGVTEKKTHSSSIDVDAAERVRKHFRDAADEEAAAEQKVVAEKAAKEAAAKAARMKPTVAAPPPAPAVAAAPRAPAVLDPAPPVAPLPPVSVVPKPAPATVMAAKVVSAVPPVPVKPAPVPPAATAKPATRPGVTASASPKPIAPHSPAVAKPAPAPLAASARPATSPAVSARHGAATHPTSSAKSAPKPNWNPLPPGARVNPPAPLRPTASARPRAPTPREPREITITEGVTVRDLAEKLDVRAKEVLKILLDRGIFASINQALDTAMATNLAESFNGIVKVLTFEQDVVQEVAREEKPENLEPRPPVVTVMGHVDHGKTSLLDVIRETEVAAGEAGGITQHIGASVVHIDGRKIVFVDTPGHEAFTRMRARVAKVTDILVLVVAADDGVIPQTQEAIDHARAAGVPIIVAINKIDKPEAQVERVKRQLSERGLMPEEWGGDTVMVEVSAKQKKNLNKLLEMILLVADLRELKSNPKAPAAGTVLESRVDKGRGAVATIMVQTGTLHTGDVFICGAVYGKVRAMFDDHGRPVRSAGPSTPVEVLGLQGAPEAGDQFQVADEARARHIVEFRQGKLREATLAKSAGARITLDQLHEQLKAGDVKELPLVIKADVQGSVEVLSEMLPKLSDDRVKLKIIHASIGAVTENDVLLASASGAIIVAFNVRPDRKASDLAQREGVEVRPHTIIYEVSDEIKKAMTGLLDPVFKETHLGRAEVRNTFRVKGVGMIAGCYVLDGVLKRDAEVRVLR